MLPVAPVYDVAQALDSPFVEATGMIRNVPHPATKDLRVLTSPIKIDGERADARRRRPRSAPTNSRTLAVRRR